MYKLSRIFSFGLYGISGVALLGLLCSAAIAETPNDPMRPPNTRVLKHSSRYVQHYYLSSILISPENRSAIINGKNVGVGDRVGNARVTHIQGNEVIISIAGKTRTLTLLPLSIKKPAEASRQ